MTSPNLSSFTKVVVFATFAVIVVDAVSTFTGKSYAPPRHSHSPAPKSPRFQLVYLQPQMFPSRIEVGQYRGLRYQLVILVAVALTGVIDDFDPPLKSSLSVKDFS